LKYRVEEETDKYECYMLPEAEEAVFSVEDFSAEDIGILEAFAL
jgi:hypothetical protein